MRRLLEITVCPREAGRVVLPVERGGRPERMDARRIATRLERLIARRGLTGRVWVREECAGGCQRPGPNVSVDAFRETPAGEEQDHVVVGGKSYVYSLASLPALAAIIDENLTAATPRGRRAGRSGRRRRRPRS